MSGDVLVMVLLLLFLIPIIIAGLFYSAYKKNVKRAQEQLNIEKQQTFHMQKQIDELNMRIAKIESLLKEVE